MTYKELGHEYAWQKAESVMLAGYARERGYAVTWRQVFWHISPWRDLFYGLIDDDTLADETGARRLLSASDAR